MKSAFQAHASIGFPLPVPPIKIIVSSYRAHSPIFHGRRSQKFSQSPENFAGTRGASRDGKRLPCASAVVAPDGRVRPLGTGGQARTPEPALGRALPAVQEQDRARAARDQRIEDRAKQIARLGELKEKMRKGLRFDPNQPAWWFAGGLALSGVAWGIAALAVHFTRGDGADGLTTNHFQPAMLLFECAIVAGIVNCLVRADHPAKADLAKVQQWWRDLNELQREAVLRSELEKPLPPVLAEIVLQYEA